MQKPILFSCIVLSAIFLNSGCKDASQSSNHTSDSTANVSVKPVSNLVSEVISKEARDKMTPASVLHELMEGNNRFLANNLTPHNLPAQVKNSAGGQNPKAIILSCIDSRVPVEEVFDENIGDIFVARVAGNIINDDILGSIEYACKYAGAKLVMVMGHESCGAVKAAIDNVVDGKITTLVAKIKPAVTDNKAFAGEKTSKNHELVDAVCKSNVKNNIAIIRKSSSILNQMEKDGKIKIIGAYYDLETGKVSPVE